MTAPHGGRYGAGVIVIKVAGADITKDVLYSDASFMQAVSGRPGRFAFRVKDVDHAYNFVAGARVTLDIQDLRQFDGYAFIVNHKYAFPVEDTVRHSADRVPRIWQLEGPDLNILFQKRYTYDQSDPSQKLPVYPANTTDKAMIEDMVATMLDLTGDDISLNLDVVASPNEDASGSVADIGMTWGQAMGFVSGLPGGIFYLDPDRTLQYHDDDTADAPGLLTDQPFNEKEYSGGRIVWQDQTIARWQPNTLYGPNDYVVADDDISVFGFALDDPGMSGPTEPVWAFVDLTPDGDIAWFPVFPWNPEELYGQNEIVVPITENGHLYTSINDRGDGFSGISGAIEPVWPTDGSTVEDGDIPLTFEFGPLQVGYSNMSWTSDGTKMVNDALAWGAGTGSPTAVFSRVQDAGSIEAHGRWQIPEQYRWDMYKQATINKFTRSLVYGSPSNLRGAKDPPSQVTLRILEHGFRAGMKAEVQSGIFGMDEVIPVREMKITFPTPYDVFYDLGLWHEIDQPWTFAEFKYPNFHFPPIPRIPPIVYPPPIHPIEHVTAICFPDAWQNVFGNFSYVDPGIGPNPAGGATYSSGVFSVPAAVGAGSSAFVESPWPFTDDDTGIRVLLDTATQSDSPSHNSAWRIYLPDHINDASAAELIVTADDGGFLSLSVDAGFGSGNTDVSNIAAGSSVWVQLNMRPGNSPTAHMWPVGSSIDGVGSIAVGAAGGTAILPTYIGMGAGNVSTTEDKTWAVRGLEVLGGGGCGYLVNVFAGGHMGPVQIGRGNGLQDEFTLPTRYVDGTLTVYVNGVAVIPAISDPDTGVFTLSPIPADGDVITAEWTVPFDPDQGRVPTSSVVSLTQNYTGTGGELIYYTLAPFLPNSQQVWVNGVLQIPGQDYEAFPDNGHFDFVHPPTGLIVIKYQTIGVTVPTGGEPGGGT